MPELLAISVRQPAAGLIAAGRKTIEVRTWRTRHRGPLVICASAAPSDQGPAGCTLCVVRVLDCRPLRRWHAAAACMDLDWMDDEDLSRRWAWVLGTPRPVAQRPVRGQAAFYYVDIEEEVT